ncbi:iron-containing alcohol dehydrogenase, partial [Escherichia coli]|uniref:iron-containing alcohol dehydrogenase n=1 Tax=Escherichia coli TaxID=562 RepID=UPI0025AE1075
MYYGFLSPAKRHRVSFRSSRQPNPTTENVAAELKLLTENCCDSGISLGGGSPHDCAKGIALVATNAGNIRDYEGVDRSAKRMLPMIE